DSVKVEQAISADNRNYNVAPPTSGATKVNMGVTNNMYTYNSTTGNYELVGESTELQPGSGYILRSDVGKIIFSGDINLTDISVPLTWSSASRGWNMVGNPFTASVDWASISKTNVTDGFWLWDNIQNVYGVYNQELGTGVNLESSIIPSNHAFFVKIPTETRELESSITFEIANIQTNGNSYLKSGQKAEALKIAGSNGEARDETALALNSSASDQLDNLDTEKMLAYSSSTIELFSLVGGKNIAINALPDNTWDEKTVSLGYYANQPGEYNIELTEKSIDDLNQVILKDHLENKEWLLDETSPYAFTVNHKGSNNTRFSITLVRKSVPTSVEKPDTQKQDKCLIYTQNSNIIVKTPNNHDIRYHLTDINGRSLKNGSLLPLSENQIETPQTGIYILTIVSDKGKEKHKVAVE
ncbi:T9SS type A sorting domain-containing protein, partial [Marinilabilia sp.]